MLVATHRRNSLKLKSELFRKLVEFLTASEGSSMIVEKKSYWAKNVLDSINLADAYARNPSFLFSRVISLKFS